MATELAPERAGPFTTADVEAMSVPEGWTVEVISGEVYVSKQPSNEHQDIGLNIASALLAWSKATRLGRPTVMPGVIYADSDAVSPDVVWASNARRLDLDAGGHFVGLGPELVVEILSPGPANVRRDRVTKPALYEQRAVVEYWVCDPRTHTLDVYRRDNATALVLNETLSIDDTLVSPLLPGFQMPLREVFST